MRDIPGFRFKNTETTAKILAKIPPECATVDILLSLRGAMLLDKTQKILCHMKKLNADVLTLAANPPLLEASTPSLLDEVAESPDEKYQALTSAEFASSKCQCYG